MQQKQRHREHILNSSSAKQKYSFSKDQRFKPLKPVTDVSYLPKQERDRKSALIGYGERSLGINHKQKIYQQIPHAYDIPSSIDVKRGYSFHGGRYQLNSYLPPSTSPIPGPNNYDLPTMLEHRGVCLKPKLPDFTLKQVAKIPGPGAYEVPSTMRVQKNVMDSKFSNPGLVKISRSLDITRRKEPVQYIPGPGQYDVQKYGIGNPENPIGRNQNTKFGKSAREQLAIKGSQKFPGPGQYVSYSEFD